MMLQALSNDYLESRLRKLVGTERKITHLILECVAEIDRRKLYLQKAYPSLFEFLVKEYGYSAASAMRRIEAARLLIQLPEVSKKIESGALNLSQVALVQRAEREYKKSTKTWLSLETKRELLVRIENQTQSKTEMIISQELDVTFEAKNKLTHHKDESVTLTLTFTKDQLANLEQAQSMLSHAVPDKNWASLISYLAQKEISRRTGSKTSKKSEVKYPKRETKISHLGINASQRKAIASRPEAKAITSVAETSYGELGIVPSEAPIFSSQRKVIGRRLRRQLLSKDSFCGYRDPQTGKTCGSRYFLQIDHIKSVSIGGNNELENLQVLCGKHNRHKYAQEVSQRKWLSQSEKKE